MVVDSVISAFSADHVARITGLNARQLSYWDRIGFFKPAYAPAGESAKPLKVYSFNDVVGLRVIAVLRNDYKVSVQHLRRVAEKLSEYTDSPWSSLKLMVCKGEVSVLDPETGHGRGVFSGQYVLVPLIDQIRHVRKAASLLSERSADQIGVVEKHRNVAHNVRVFAGTRVPTRAIQRFLEAGYSVEDILREYPSLRGEDVNLIKRENKLAAA